LLAFAALTGAAVLYPLAELEALSGKISSMKAALEYWSMRIRGGDEMMSRTGPGTREGRPDARLNEVPGDVTDIHPNVSSIEKG
jgi:hypothetical protein